MSAKHQMMTTAAIALMAIGGCAGFKAGSFWQHKLDNQEAVRVEAAHWDPRTAEFTWGSAEASHLAQLDPDDLMRPLVSRERPSSIVLDIKPEHKPRVSK